MVVCLRFSKFILLSFIITCIFLSQLFTVFYLFICYYYSIQCINLLQKNLPTFKYRTSCKYCTLFILYIFLLYYFCYTIFFSRCIYFLHCAWFNLFVSFPPNNKHVWCNCITKRKFVISVKLEKKYPLILKIKFQIPLIRKLHLNEYVSFYKFLYEFLYDKNAQI